jgi:hypothetical protein
VSFVVSLEYDPQWIGRGLDVLEGDVLDAAARVITAP